MDQIVELLTKCLSEMADVLESCAADPSHQPAIYAAFIREIVRKTKEARPSSPQPANTASNVEQPPPSAPNLDPQLLDQTATWQSGNVAPDQESKQFAFIPQGGDMMSVAKFLSINA